MRKALFAGLLVVLAACAPVRQVDITWGPSPWYTYCSWDAPCWYGPNQVFIYRWGYIDRPTYLVLRSNPGRREGWANRRRDWHPGKKPHHRGSDWNARNNDQGNGKDKGKHNGKDRGKDNKPRDRNH
jgi:hypothetical protein